jgi:hypothetical protein
MTPLICVFIDYTKNCLNNNMPLTIYGPRIIEEIVSGEAAFTDGQGSLDRPFNVNTVIPIKSTALSTGQLLSTGSRSLVFRDFGIVNPGTVQGVELDLEITRLARVQDKTIQIWYNGQTVGRNRADLAAGDRHIYGGQNDLWDTTGIDVTSAGFGFLIDLQPHTEYPSSNTVYLRRLSLRLYTA